MFKFLTIYILLVIWSISRPSPLNAQLSWKINAEGGYFTSHGSTLKNQDDLLLKFDGDLHYLYKFSNKTLSFKLRVRPELYGYHQTFKVIKFRGEGSYSQKGNKYGWGLHFINHHYRFSGESLDQIYNTLFIQTHLQWFSNPGRFFHLAAAYAFQNTDFQGDLNLDLIFIEGTAYIIPNKYIRYGLGAYTERFIINYNMLFNYIAEKKSNSGWRIGPSLSFNYLKDIFLKVDYRFLLHYSQITQYPSYEQRVRALAGVIFFSHWSIFVFTDYYIRNFSQKETDMEKLSILYTPINLENRIYLKLSYDLAENIDLYVKYGYFNENLSYYGQGLAGLSGLIGFEIRK